GGSSWLWSLHGRGLWWAPRGQPTDIACHQRHVLWLIGLGDELLWLAASDGNGCQCRPRAGTTKCVNAAGTFVVRRNNRLAHRCRCFLAHKPTPPAAESAGPPHRFTPQVAPRPALLQSLARCLHLPRGPSVQSVNICRR